MYAVGSVTASHHVWNSAKTWYNINKNANKTRADNNIFTNIVLAFLKFDQLHQSVMYKYQETITMITMITPYRYQNNFAILMIKSDVFDIN